MTAEVTSLSVLSRRIAAELAEGAQLCRQAEALAAGLAAEGGAPLERLSSLQALDELSQRLSSLATVLEGVADQATTSWTLDLEPLLAQVQLGQLAIRLGGSAASPADAGEAEIF